MYQRRDEIRRLPRHFKGKCIIQCQKTSCEAKVLDLSAGEGHKANIQQHKRMIEREKIDSFSTGQRPDLNPPFGAS